MPHLKTSRSSIAAVVLVLAFCSALAAQTEGPAVRGRVRSPHGPLRQACESCHATAAWKPLRASIEFNHSTETGYPLLGMHANVECRACHVNPVFANVPGNCSACHADFHRRQMTGECSDCHTVRGWKVSMSSVRDHRNRFPLIGAHAALQCESCHVGAASGRFTGLSTACASCHMRDYQQARAVNHQGFATTCEGCHSLDTWKNARFDHAFTRFPLTGAHARFDCQGCHRSGTFQGLSPDCASCHLPQYNAAANPDHKSANFPTTCGTCHTTIQWQGAKFDHNLTKFPLTGKHATTECTQCHVGGKFAGLGTACANCHLSAYNSTTNPNHQAAGFPTTCETCHTTTQWQGAKFDHNATKFPLTGKHATTECTQCHVGGKFAGLGTACANCHLNAYNGTTNPNHRAAGFPQDCSLCHTTTQWTGATFNHSATAFPLTGKHTTVQCAQCHVNGKYSGLSAACASCHLSAYNGTTNPNHKSAGFPTTCEICHNTTQWPGATFNHSATAFPLTGKHTTVACAQCHVNGVYKGTPTDCYSCHKTEYTTVTDPNHAASGFPTTCQTCHTTTQWSGAKFNHTWFPIYSGAHAGKWQTCSTCHSNPSDYTVFSCTNCHEHAKTSMDSKHSGVRGYVYNSLNCYSCHPSGRN